MNTFISPDARYVLPNLEERTSYGFKRQDPYSKLFEDRVIFLGTQIDNASADDIMAQLLVLEAMNSEADITMYIHSPGGDIQSLAAILDTMEYIAPDVATVCLGQASSAAAVVLAAGAPGKRMALPNSRIMIHQPSTTGARGQASDISIAAAEIKRMRLWIEELLAEYTGQDLETIKRDINRDKFLTAQGALDYGIVDLVLPSRKRSKKQAIATMG